MFDSGNMDGFNEILQKKKCISLTTFKKNGEGVSTPVWFVQDNGKLLLFSETDTWKLKRMRNNSHVEFAPCTTLGKIKGQTFKGEARFIEDETGRRLLKLMKRKYPLMYRLLIRENKKDFTVFEIQPTGIKN